MPLTVIKYKYKTNIVCSVCKTDNFPPHSLNASLVLNFIKHILLKNVLEAARVGIS